MATYGDQKTIAMNAAADLSGARYHIVRASAAGACNIASHDTNSGMVGVLQNKPESGERARVAYMGESKIVAGAAITANAFVTCNGSARAVAASSGDMVCGRAIEAAGADGEVITALLFPPIRWAGAI